MAQYLNQQVGNYHLTQLLGKGGFGTVYLGEHIYLGTQAAIKVVNEVLSNQDIQIFAAEARTIARLVHPHIVRVLEFGVEDNLPFLVMDYAPHGSLKDRHPSGEQVPLPTIVSYVKQIADALQYAHDQKLIHRDIKPENLLVGQRNEVLLSDFGIAVIAHSTRSQRTEEVIGTWPYMAPEQFRGRPQPATDQYALGILVYRWLSGSLPFQGSYEEVYHQQLNVSPAPLRLKLPMLPPAVEQTVFKALSKEPAQRFPHIQDFAQALEQASQSSQSTFISPLAQKPHQDTTRRTPPTIAATNTPPIPLPQTILAPNVRKTSIPQIPPSSSLPFSENLTEEQIYQTMISKTNPYTSWGKLVLDDDTKKIWGTSKDNLLEKTYQGDLYKLEETYRSRGFQTMKQFYKRTLRKFDITDFVYQVQVTLVRGDRGAVGLLFRADAGNEMYYQWGLDYEDDKFDGYARAMIHYGEETSSSIEDGEHFPVNEEGLEKDLQYLRELKVRDLINEGKTLEAMKLEEEFNLGLGPLGRRPTRKAASQPSKTSYLLAVVAQGINLDFYVDCKFVKRVSSNTISHGTIGIFVSGARLMTALFGHAKVWVK